MRNALAQTLFELAQEDDRIVVLVADISPAGAMNDFRKKFPDRFYNVGVSEQAMIGLAAGMAQRRLRPFCYTIATFALFRAYEFVRCDLAYQDLPVTVVGMGAGLAYSTLGGTHQAIEDVAVACAMPNMTVLAPCDPAETAECTRWCAARKSGGPVYLRLGKSGECDLTREADTEPWAFGQLRWLCRSRGNLAQRTHTCVLSYGPIVTEAAEVADLLDADLAVVPTLAPTCAGLSALPDDYGRVIVVEEASGAPLYGQVLAAVQDRELLSFDVHSFALPREFGHIHGTRAELLDHYGLTAEKIIDRLK